MKAWLDGVRSPSECQGVCAGNVGRFINHSCHGNLVVQPVLQQGSSLIHYKVGLFAKEDIPAFTELTYDYKWEVEYGERHGIIYASGVM